MEEIQSKRKLLVLRHLYRIKLTRREHEAIMFVYLHSQGLGMDEEPLYVEVLIFDHKKKAMVYKQKIEKNYLGVPFS